MDLALRQERLCHHRRARSSERPVPSVAPGRRRVRPQLPELISQRRRWLNGSFFAAIHSVVHFGYLYRSSHGFARKFWLHIELFYTTFNMVRRAAATCQRSHKLIDLYRCSRGLRWGECPL
jgi:cellulose synthase/poly-beta-1,6-N-acetylglucosamine synthase-like glycosyltransferase